MKLSNKQRIEISAYIVTTVLAVPTFILALLVPSDSPFRDLLINLAATFAGAGFLFFLLNRFYGLESDSSEQFAEIQQLLKDANRLLGDRNPHLLYDQDERRRYFPLKDHFSDAQHIDVLGNSLTGFLETWRDLLVQRIQQGTKVRLLLIDPDSKFPNLMREVWPYATLSSDLERSLIYIRGIHNAISKNGKTMNGSMEVGFIAWNPSCTFILIDPLARTGKAMVTYNNPNYSTPISKRPHVLLNNREDQRWMEYYTGEFNRAWESSRQLVSDTKELLSVGISQDNQASK